jgi:cytochrome P450
MHLKLGEVSYIIVSSPEMAKEFMKTHDLAFCDRPNLLMPTLWSYNATNIAFSTYGEHWRQLKKICVVELLNTKRVESFRHIREEEVSKLVKSISASEGSVVNLTEMIISMTCGITALAAFGKKNKHEQVFKSAMEESVCLLGELCIADFYPSIQFFKTLSRGKTKMEKIHRVLDMILQNIIDEHKSSPLKDDEDLVDVLIKIQQENNLSQHPFTDENIKSVIQVGYLIVIHTLIYI